MAALLNDIDAIRERAQSVNETTTLALCYELERLRFAILRTVTALALKDDELLMAEVLALAELLPKREES